MTSFSCQRDAVRHRHDRSRHFVLARIDKRLARYSEYLGDIYQYFSGSLYIDQYIGQVSSLCSDV